MTEAVVDARQLAIVRRAGTFFALDGVCTHEGGPLGEGTLDGGELVCPWHEGRYNLATGEANPEANWVRDLKTFPVRTAMSGWTSRRPSVRTWRLVMEDPRRT